MSIKELVNLLVESRIRLPNFAKFAVFGLNSLNSESEFRRTKWINSMKSEIMELLNKVNLVIETKIEKSQSNNCIQS